MNTTDLKIIAYIENDFNEKFGIPRQSGLAESLTSRIVFTPEYRVREAFRGLEEYSHIWLLWLFSETLGKDRSPTVRPPKLGGNKRMGVFATRSPYRPNSIGLSSVRLEKIEYEISLGPVLYVSGADLMNGTPILDIKPYLAYTDSHPEASRGFALSETTGLLNVEYSDDALNIIPVEKQKALLDVLSQDPRPGYQEDRNRIYKMNFSDFEVHFSVEENNLKILKITDSGC